MNKYVKILILAVGVALAIGGVLMFLKTIVEPPRSVAFSNQYDRALSSDISGKLHNVDNIDELAANYRQLSDLVGRMHDEGRIDTPTYNARYTEIVGEFAPQFAAYCHSRLTRNSWNASTLRWMADGIDALKGLTLDDGSRYILGQFPASADSLAVIRQAIRDYHAATSLARRTGWAGLNNAQALINESYRYLNAPYLGYNADLVQSLRDVPRRLAASHYAWLERQVETLAEYSGYTRTTYKNNAMKVLDAIKQYKNTNIYGNAKPDVGVLEQRAQAYHIRSGNYYSH